MATQGGMSKEDFIARVEISMVMQGLRLWGPRPLEHCVHLKEWERITDEEVTWYLVTGPETYFRGREDLAAMETNTTIDFDETAATEDLDDTLEATMEEERDETPGPAPDKPSGAASGGQQAKRVRFQSGG